MSRQLTDVLNLKLNPTLFKTPPTSSRESPMLIPERGVSSVFWKVSLTVSILSEEICALRVNL